MIIDTHFHAFPGKFLDLVPEAQNDVRGVGFHAFDHLEYLDTMDKYGIDSLQNYFEIAIDCARNGDSEKNTIDAGDTINADGDKPRCFYSIPVKKRVGATGGSGGGGLLGDNVKGYELEDLF